MEISELPSVMMVNAQEFREWLNSRVEGKEVSNLTGAAPLYGATGVQVMVVEELPAGVTLIRSKAKWLKITPKPETSDGVGSPPSK